MQMKSSPVYLYEVDDLLGGDALTPYDLASLASEDIKWKFAQQEDIVQINNASYRKVIN